MDFQASTSDDTVSDQVSNVPSSTNDTKKEPLESIPKHYISETNGPEDKFPSNIDLRVNDICENPILKNDEKCSKQLTETRFVQINSLASNRVEYHTEIISTKELKQGTTMTESARKKAQKLGEKNDDAGHLLAKNLGGKGDEHNVIPQNANINRGNWKTMENFIYKNDVKKDPLKFTYRVIYDDKPRELLKTRPKEFLFKVETLNNELIRFGKVENPPNEIVEFKLQEYLSKNFEKIWDSQYGRKFVLSLKENILSDILFSKDLTQNEYFIWRVIHDWVKFDQDKRLEHLPLLIGNFFQFTTLSDYFINVFISNCALFSKIDGKQYICENLKQCAENSKKSSVKEKGETTSLENLLQNLKITNHWENSVTLFKSQKYYSNLRSLKKIPICGSCKTNHFEIFDSKIWKSFQISSLKKWGFSIFSISPEICTANNNCNCLASISCELYENKKWSEIEIIKNARKYASIVVHNNCIYIAGGINSEGSLEKIVEKYDSKTEKLEPIESMITARRNFSLVLYKNRLWAIGGIDDNLPLSSVESYDFDNNVWQKEKSLNDTRYNHAAIEFEGELYVVGGLGQKDDLVVERYQDNTESNHWVLSSKLNEAIPNPHLVILAYP